MTLMEEIQFYIKDEKEANETYSRMANDADDAGMHDTARILRGMAADELRHKEMLEGMYYKPEFGPMREEVEGALGYIGRKFGYGMPETPSPRPFAKTYGDWVNLAEDIKEKMPEPGAWNIVNGLLQVISEGGPEAEEAKRWLVKKAGELGIK